MQFQQTYIRFIWTAFFMILAMEVSLNAEDKEVSENLSIEELIQQALQQNPALMTAEAAVATAKGERRIAGQWKNPEISAEYGEKRVNETTGDVSAKGYAQRYHFAQVFEFPGKASLRKAIADRNIEMAELALYQLRQEIAATAYLLAIEWLTADRELKAANQVEERHESLVKTLQKRANGGVQLDVDRRIIEADRVRILAQTHKTEEKRLAAQVALNVLQGKAPDTPVSIKADLEPKPLAGLDYESLFERATKNNLALKSQEIKVSRSALQLDQARKGAAPDITVAPFFSEETVRERECIIGIGLSLPLPLWNSNRGQVDVAKADMIQTKSKASQALRDLQRDLSQQYHAYQHILHLVKKIPLSSLDELQDAAEFTDRQYRSGAITIQTYMDMQDKYLEATSTLLDTIREGHEHFLRIQLLTNDPILGSRMREEPLK